MASCTESFYLPEGSPLFCRSFGWLLVALAAAVLVSFVFGLVGCSKKCYRIIALMSTGVVSKLALIPDVEDDVSDSEDEEDNSENQTRREKCSQWIKKALTRQKHRTISFKTCDGAEDAFYGVFPWAPMLLLPAAIVLILAYATVFITTQWTLTTNCSDDQSGNTTAMYYKGLSFCPPVNCSAWNVNKSGELIEVPSSNAFDPFNPLERFVSLLAVQVAVLQFFACIVNKGCCWEFKHPPCRYTLICIFDIVFVLIVIAATIVIGTRQVDRADTFEKLTIPFVHLIFVSFAECMILSIFVLVICCNVCDPDKSRGELDLEDEIKKKTNTNQEDEPQGSSTITNGNSVGQPGSDSEISGRDTDQSTPNESDTASNNQN